MGKRGLKFMQLKMDSSPEWSQITTTGLTAVYGHLSVFTENLETELHKRQERLNSYHTNSYFDSTSFPFKKGDIIGYTGNTGASFGPHLHFEIREKNGKTLNPLKQKYSFPDSAITPSQINLTHS